MAIKNKFSLTNLFDFTLLLPSPMTSFLRPTTPEFEARLDRTLNIRIICACLRATTISTDRSSEEDTYTENLTRCKPKRDVFGFG